MSDNPANPFQTITPLKMQYTDCGAHTHTQIPDLDHRAADHTRVAPAIAARAVESAFASEAVRGHDLLRIRAR